MSITVEEKGWRYFRQLLGRRKTYYVYFFPDNDGILDSFEVYAVSDTSLRWFLKQEYRYETITAYRKVSLC